MIITIGSKTFTDAQIESLKINSSICDDSKLSFGNTIATTVDLILLNITSSGTDDTDVLSSLKGETMRISHDNTPYGVYKVRSVDRDGIRTQIRASDALEGVGYAQIYTSGLDWTGGQSLANMAREIDANCNYAEFDTSYTLSSAPEGYTKREIMGYIASVYASNYIINRNGNGEFVFLSDTSIANIDPIDTFALKADYVSTKVTAIRINDDDNLSYGTVDYDNTQYNEMQVDIDCPIMPDDAVLDLWGKVHNYTYRAFDADNNAIMALLPGDCITVEDERGQQYDTLIFTNELTYTGAFAQHLSSTADTNSDRATMISQKSETEKELQNEIDDLAESIEELEVTVNGNFDISDELTTNIKSYFLHGDAYYNKARKITVWNNTDTYIFVNTPSSFVAQQTHIENSNINLLETTYSSGNSYSYANTVGLEIGGQQVYYTAIGSQTGAYQSYTFTDPRAIYGNNVDVKAFEVRLPRSTTKTVAKWDWELESNEYIPKIIKNRTTDQKANGFKFKDDGSYLVKSDFESEIPPIILVTDINNVPSDAPVGSIIGVYTEPTQYQQNGGE